uniref:Thiosulfate/3-mercaptopyruvate sulfurtransferase n=1 Tax=Candidatus Kentrum sp. LFY TaxID=2126342 RepID=A0A450UVX6_9GAMM|nr:MAG: thiosulfate/3-mercaptopyruvate sulfurtransferase [Candidatus Kentron sp. LFY]
MKIHKGFPGVGADGRRYMSWSVAFLCFAWLLGGASASAAALPGPVVDSAWLAKNLDKVMVLDVRKDLKSFEKKAKGAAGPVNPCGPGGKKGKKPLRGDGHIPGAVLVDAKKILGKYKLAGKTVKFMVPEKKAFERLMQKSGVNRDSTVVITGKGEQMLNVAFTTRLYWTMKYFGFDKLAILDGGTAQWKKDGHKVAYGKSKRLKAGDFDASAQRKQIRATMEEVVALTKKKGKAKEQILDVRGKPFYLGLTYNRKVQLPVSKGHIPTAKNFPVDFFVETAGAPATLYDKKDIEEVAKLSGIDLSRPTITSCHTGITATIAWFVISEVLGNENARVYDGSMHEWSMTGKPVARPLD